MNVFPTIFKLDTKGKTREWRMEVDGDRYRTVAGLQDGKQVTSEWKVAYAKNTGRSNATTAEEQAIAEVEAQYKKQLDKEYKRDLADVGKNIYYKPMLATEWSKRKAKIVYPVYVQPKLDGIRCVMTKEGAFSRTGKPIVAIPHIIEVMRPYFELNPSAVLDGELYNHDLKDDFNKIVSLVRKTKPEPEDLVESEQKVQYHIYDKPSAEGNFSDRYVDLMIGLPIDDSIVVVTTNTAQNEAEVDTHYGCYLEQGFEGGIVRLDTPYEQKRSNGLIKRKDFEDAEFEIIRIEEGQGNWSGYAKRVIFRNNDGTEVGAGLAGNQAYCKQILADATDYVGKQVTVQFFTRTPDGIPRFPIAKVLHKETRW